VTALPEPDPDSEPRLLTVAEYAELGETENGYTELQEGHVLMSPSPRASHSRASGRLLIQIDPQVPADLYLLQDVDVNLALTRIDQPGFVRRPDLFVADKAAYDRTEADGSLLCAADVRLAVEIVSPGSRRMDNVIKLGEYADAGIPHYWVIDLEPPISVHVWHLADEYGYQDSGTFTGQVTLAAPFDVQINLGTLL
jgi:Uma2 family endonuclease